MSKNKISVSYLGFGSIFLFITQGLSFLTFNEPAKEDDVATFDIISRPQTATSEWDDDESEEDDREDDGSDSVDDDTE